jgi:dihydroorotase-like cyclic amidohydrolase
MTAEGTTWVIRGARPLGGEPADIILTGGTITAVGTRDGIPAGAQVLDAAGLIALPGLVDLHTHLREPGREDAETIETGTLAAALGGFTAVHAMANTDPVADTAGVTEQIWRLGRSVPSRSGWAGRGWPSSAQWPSPPPGSGCSPTTVAACPTRCSCGGRSNTSRPSAG